MKTIVLSIVFACMGLILTTPVTPAAHAANSDRPTLIMFYSDYCGNCRILAPKIKEALNDIEPNKLRIIKFDYTSREQIMASKDLAREAGLTELQKKYGAKTGFAVLTNMSGEEIATLNVDDTTESIHEKISAAIAEQG